MSHHTDLLLHHQDPFRAYFHLLPLFCGFFLYFHENFLERRVLIFLLGYVLLKLLVVFVNLRLAVLLHILHFLNEILHQDVDFTS